ncbi:MAG: hemerythrin domain-containing protein [Planctomycetota bacterium]
MGHYDIRIDREACVGDHRCGEHAPGTFAVDTEGKAAVIDPPGDDAAQILAAAQACRHQAITILDTATGREVEIGRTLRASSARPELLDRVLREHGALRIAARTLRALLDAPASGGEERIRSWTAQVAESLRTLQGSLAAHFRMEEARGFFAELAAVHPSARGRLDALQAEHGEILADLQALLAALSALSGRAPALDRAGLGARATEILGRLVRHESAETELIGRLLREDLGGGD